MNYQKWAGRVLFGRNRRGALLAMGVAVLLGLGALLVYPALGDMYSPLGVMYWLLPSTLVNWPLVFGFLVLPAYVAFVRAGLLTSLLVDIPAHVVVGHHYYTSVGGRFVSFGYTGSRTVDIIVVSSWMAVKYGLVGYLLGTAIRWSTDRLSLTRAPTN